MADVDALLVEYDTWLRVERGLAPNSLAAYRRDLRRYADHLRRHGDLTLASVDESTVAGFVDGLREARRDDGRPQYAPASIARAVAAVHSFHRFCLEEGLGTTDPSDNVGAPRVPQGIPKALTEVEVEALLDAVYGDEPRALRDRAILETLYAGGVRISELVGLDRADLDLHDGMARVLGKGSKERVVPLGRGARDAL
ncbi:MAG: tyrosine-type recombinase/integrase, partial [Acidimicrobiia bacterium]